MADGTIDVSGIDHGELLAALHNGTRPLGMGRLQARGDMTAEEGRDFLAGGGESARLRGLGFTVIDGGMDWRVDYVHGRPIKVRVKGDQLHGARLYDRDAGEGACARIVEALRKKVAL